MSLTFEISDIHKSYNGKRVLRGCSFSFSENGVYVLMGPNGSGKSTLFRLCALLEHPDRGEILYRAEDMSLPRDISLRRRITLVLPKIGVFNTSVFHNVSYGLRLRDMRKKDYSARVERSLEFVGLADRREQNALTLSSGETQRLGIARAIVIEPEILFLDEPAAFVDEENKRIIEDIILRIKRNDESMVIITTHDRAQAERLGDRILLLQNGKMVTVPE